jgi:hypothetical protein
MLKRAMIATLFMGALVATGSTDAPYVATGTEAFADFEPLDTNWVAACSDPCHACLGGCSSSDQKCRESCWNAAAICCEAGGHGKKEQSHCCACGAFP